MDDWRQFLKAVSDALRREKEKRGDTAAIRQMWEDALKRMENSDEQEHK